MGSGGIGAKTTSITQYVENFFLEEVDPTVEGTYTKQVEIDNQICVLDILDTPGQDEFITMWEQ
jgi:GTPase SAR1 family protein